MPRHVVQISTLRQLWMELTTIPASDTTTACTVVLGLPKVAFAIFCTILAMIVWNLCIPLMLLFARRRPAGDPVLNCGYVSDEGRLKAALGIHDEPTQTNTPH